MKTLDGVVLVGLTGQSGAGKSTASAYFRDYKIPVIDCDKVAHKVSEYPDFLADVSKVFPDCVDSGGLMRKKLGAVVFNDPKKLKAYGKIIFPYITAEIFKEIREIKGRGERLIILDAPTLFESGIDAVCGAVVSVVAPFDIKLTRVLSRDGIPVEFAKSRLSSQFSEKYFYDRSDYVIVNDGDMTDLRNKVISVAKELMERFDI